MTNYHLWLPYQFVSPGARYTVFFINTEYQYYTNTSYASKYTVKSMSSCWPSIVRARSTDFSRHVSTRRVTLSPPMPNNPHILKKNTSNWHRITNIIDSVHTAGQRAGKSRQAHTQARQECGICCRVGTSVKPTGTSSGAKTQNAQL